MSVSICQKFVIFQQTEDFLWFIFEIYEKSFRSLTLKRIKIGQVKMSFTQKEENMENICEIILYKVSF